MAIIKRPNWYDFQNVSKDDLDSEQSSYLDNLSKSNLQTLGSGVELLSASEPVIFDSSNLSVTQQSWVSGLTFDGRGILESAYTTTDQVGGNQIRVNVSGAKLDGSLTMIITILGKNFDGTLTYEHIRATNNGDFLTNNHFKEVINVMFQNFLRNNNSGGTKNAGGAVVITEASSMFPALDLVGAEQTTYPDDIFADNYRQYTGGLTLEQVIQEALGPSNDVDDLDINTTTASTRTLAAGGSTDIILGQKFLLKTNNIQNVTLRLKCDTPSTWTGTLNIGIRALQENVDESCLTSFLPENQIEFDPDTVSIQEISYDRVALEANGQFLTTNYSNLDFSFASTNIANSAINGLEQEKYYVVTIQRTGDTSTGTITFEEAPNTESDKRLTIYQNGFWTDVSSSTMWFKVWSNSSKVASGAAFDEGIRVESEKVIVDSSGAQVSNVDRYLSFATTTEDTKNYLIMNKGVVFSDTESHPKTGDSIFSRAADAPVYSTLDQTSTQSLIETKAGLNVLARVKDTNSRAVPNISGTFDYPGLAIHNEINLINPSTDVLNHNLVGMLFEINGSDYRIISQETIVDYYGDANGDGLVNVSDVAAANDLDGYETHLSGVGAGAVAGATQVNAILNGSVSVPQILRVNVNAPTDQIISTLDIDEIAGFVQSGTPMTNQGSFTRVQLKVEPVSSPLNSLDSNADSTLDLHVNHPELIDISGGASFTPVAYTIKQSAYWLPESVEILDLRRYVSGNFVEFSGSDLTTDPETGGKNSRLISGDLYLDGSVKDVNGTLHALDYEKNIIEIELPDGYTVGEFNVFDKLVVGTMKFSDGSLVDASALINNQVKFEVTVSSYAKNMSGTPNATPISDGYTIDGYTAPDYDGYVGNADNIDEVIGTYIDHTSGLLRIKAYNIVNNLLYPELRTRIQITVSLKKAGFSNVNTAISSSELATLLT